MEDKDILSKDFNNKDNSNINIDIVKCFNTLFTKEGLLTNIGNIILIISFILCIITIIVVYNWGYQIFQNEIEDIILNNKKKKIKKRKLSDINKTNTKIKKIQKRQVLILIKRKVKQN